MRDEKQKEHAGNKTMGKGLQYLTTWLEISESAYRANLRFFRKLLGKNVELSAVVKANAYGHGLLSIATLAAKHGADSFCVHSLDEAMTLRKAGFGQDILIMGYIPLERMEETVGENYRIVLYNRESLEKLNEAARKMSHPVRVHLKLETGTYRQGIDEKELPAFLEALKKSTGVTLEGVYTHFANIEDTTDHEYAFLQLRRFKAMVERVQQAGFTNICRHTACSAAALLFPETHFDMVRLGISQYGLWPSRETFLSYKIKHARNDENVLKPVLSWKTRVAQIKTVPAEHSIGYGCTYQTTRDTRIAVLPVGYADGYDRRLSNQAHVLICGKRAPVRGRVCMNLTMVDVTDIPGVKLEDEVLLLGKQGKEEITADYLAGLAGTINYEFVSRINGEIERVVVG